MLEQFAVFISIAMAWNLLSVYFTILIIVKEYDVLVLWYAQNVNCERSLCHEPTAVVNQMLTTSKLVSLIILAVCLIGITISINIVQAMMLTTAVVLTLTKMRYSVKCTTEFHNDAVVHDRGIYAVKVVAAINTLIWVGVATYVFIPFTH